MQHTICFRPEDLQNFLAIQSGAKKYETRAANKIYSAIRAGDQIIFNCGKQVCTKHVVSVKTYESITNMFSDLTIEDVLPNLKNPTAQKAIKIYETFPNYKERIAKNGIIAIELE